MSHKKYYGYKKPAEYYSVKFQDDTSEGRKDMGTLLFAGYADEKFYMVKVNWGAEEDFRRSQSGEVEKSWRFDKENTKKMMLRTGTRNGWDLVNAVYERFKQHKGNADYYFIRWCERKEIEYSYDVFYH